MAHGDSQRALFNPKTIRKLCKNVRVTDAQRSAAHEWLELLNQGKLDEEKSNYPIFMKVVLEQILGYPIEKLRYEKGDIEFQFGNSGGKNVVGIEAKGTKTKDLFARQLRGKKEQETPILQTWTYIGKNDLNFGICTNYRLFVLIDRSKGLSKYHIFDFTQIANNEGKLREFIAIFSKQSLVDSNFVESLYEASLVEEREFTKEFYKLFHETRLMLIREFQSNGIGKKESIHYAQLIMNRLTFVFFAEDTGKISSHVFAERMLRVLDATPLNEHSRYASDTMLALFESLDKGAETPTHIFGFNGGLFREIIPPTVYFKDFRKPEFFANVDLRSELKKQAKLDEPSDRIVRRYRGKLNPIIFNLLAMRSFDFCTELDVNILGHIFEQSLTDLQELNGEKISKRKTEGIYYTPEYVTDYICRNTIIPHLSKGHAKNAVELIEEYADDISKLEEKFSAIKILDPACGSGAFLLKAVDILLEIHKEVQLFKEFKGHYDFTVKGKGRESIQQLTLAKWNEEAEAMNIIERNIFGVDLNEESAEITKLSLFLKIATSNRKLIDLSGNVRVGNSLVEDDAVACREAFDWKTQFDQILREGGFDLVIGNPPYIPIDGMSDAEKSYYATRFDGIYRKYDSSVLFVEKAFRLVRPGGRIGFILPLTWQTGDNYVKFRKLIFTEIGGSLINLVNLPFDVFPDAYVDTGIAIFSKTPFRCPFHAFEYHKEQRINSIDSSSGELVSPERVLQEPGLKVFATDAAYQILAKVRQGSESLGTISDSCQGIVTSKFPVSPTKRSESCLPFLQDAKTNRYLFCEKSIEYIDFTEASTIRHLYTQPKILIRRIVNRQNRLMAFYDESGLITNKDYNPFVMKDEYKSKYDIHYILALLNSRLFSYLYSIKSSLASKDDFRQTTLSELRELPIKTVSGDVQAELGKSAKRVTELAQRYYELKAKVIRRVEENFSIRSSNKIKDFDLPTFNDFKKEVERIRNRRLSLAVQDEWEPYFKQNAAELAAIRNEMLSIEHRIDETAYSLYGIADNEKHLVESRVLEAKL